MYHKFVAVEVGIRELRDNLRAYLLRVKDGEEVLVTERGKPVARISPHGRTSKRQELIAKGILHPPKKPWDPRLLDELFHLDAQLSDLLERDRDDS